MTLLTSFVISAVVLFVAWVVAAQVALPHWEHIKRHSPPVQALLYLWGFAFVGLIDAPFNIVFGTLYFRQAPNKDGCGWTLSERLRHILRTEPEDWWRWKHASFICRYLVSPWDFNHCGMGYGR